MLNHFSRIQPFGPMGCKPARLLSLRNSPDKNTGVMQVAIPFLRGYSDLGIEPRSPALQADFYHLSQEQSELRQNLSIGFSKIQKDTFQIFQSSGSVWNNGFIYLTHMSASCRTLPL